jgi:hypothetical protein
MHIYHAPEQSHVMRRTVRGRRVRRWDRHVRCVHGNREDAKLAGSANSTGDVGVIVLVALDSDGVLAQSLVSAAAFSPSGSNTTTPSANCKSRREVAPPSPPAQPLIIADNFVSDMCLLLGERNGMSFLRQLGSGA